ncbi:MAG: radical SAM protein [Candidatus Omnitrophica bacterium]|nr:radical SAM protein [Candidatus Omnitrophota bacterium]
MKKQTVRYLIRYGVHINKMNEVILFNQYFTSPKDSTEVIFATLPINLLCLASFLRNKGIGCKIYELGIFEQKEIKRENDIIRCGISDQEIAAIIGNENPKIIGLGCMYSIHYIDVLAIARLIKKVNPEIKVVLGGNHATVFSESILKDEAFDFIVRGEGELTFYELCISIFNGNSNFSNIGGLSFRDNFKNVIVNHPRGLIADLDNLPEIDYALLDVRKYADFNRRNPYLMRSPAIGIITSRGCPGKCIFCTVKAVWGRTWRGKGAKRTVDEIELLNKEYGIREFSILDDSASLDKKRWDGICSEIIKRGLDIRWTTPNGIAHWTLDKPILKKMKQSGCYRITFGIESGSQETRLFIGKDSLLSQAKK